MSPEKISELKEDLEETFQLSLPILAVIIVLSILLIFILLALAFFLRKRRKHFSKGSSSFDGVKYNGVSMYDGSPPVAIVDPNDFMHNLVKCHKISCFRNPYSIFILGSSVARARAQRIGAARISAVFKQFLPAKPSEQLLYFRSAAAARKSTPRV